VQLPTDKVTLKLLSETIGRLDPARRVTDAMICSVVPHKDQVMRRVIERICHVQPVFLNASSVVGIGIKYPRPRTIGADRIANAIAARAKYGAPVVVVDFGTAVTFDVVNKEGDYVGGIIAPGLSAMTDYLHEKTALLPRIRIRDVESIIGKSTKEAMLIGAVHGYRGLIRGLIHELRLELKSKKLPVVSTGGYAELISRSVPEIGHVDPGLTMEGLLFAAESGLMAG